MVVCQCELHGHCDYRCSSAGMGSVLSSFLNNDAAKSDLNLVAANLAGVSHSFITAPFVAMSSFVNGTAVAVEQTVGDSPSPSLGCHDKHSLCNYVV